MITDMNKYIDIGLNLTAGSFKNDSSEVLQRAIDAGVDKFVLTGTDVKHSAQAIRLSEQHAASCYATAGLHPHHASDYSHDLGSELRDMLQHDKVVAVGECGLDFNRNFSTRKEQIRAFEAQLEMAVEIGKPVFLHQRDAHDDFVAILKSYRHDLGQLVAHCFTGSMDEVNDYLLLDMYIGVTGWVCDERRGQALQQAVKHIPLDRIMLETDAPYLLPRDLQIKPKVKGRNEPCFLPHIASSVASHMNVSDDSLTAAAYKNACDFFQI